MTCVCLCVLAQWTRLILNLAINEGGSSAKRHGRFYPWGRAAGSHCIGVLGGLTVGLDVSSERKSLSPTGNRTPNRSSRGLITVRTVPYIYIYKTVTLFDTKCCNAIPLFFSILCQFDLLLPAQPS